MKKIIITEEQFNAIADQEVKDQAPQAQPSQPQPTQNQIDWLLRLQNFLTRGFYYPNMNNNDENTDAQQAAGTVSNEAVAKICQFETGKQYGYRMGQKDLYGYDNGDANGKKTYGYGLLFHPSGKKYMQDIKPVWTQPELEQLFKQMVQKKAQKVAEWADQNGVTLSQGQFDAMTSAAYNFGNKFFQKGICQVIAQNPNNPQIPEMWQHLSDAQAKKYPGLLRRRNEEAGGYQNGTTTA
jgi:GH24 family phage-related lysozyme (muramidase)